MTRSFAIEYEDLPQELSLFPLTGALLLPNGQLPLNIFEPRYLNMVLDALAGTRLIGMVQPLPGADTEYPEHTGLDVPAGLSVSVKRATVAC